MVAIPFATASFKLHENVALGMKARVEDLALS
jgi:hypothetical protein